MDNRRLIDADMLVARLRNIERALSLSDVFHSGRKQLAKELADEIDNGVYDPDPIPPTIKPGDKVRFKRSSNYGLGEVKGIDAFVKFPELTMTIRVNPDDLEVISAYGTKQGEGCKKCGIEIDDSDICLDMCNWCAMEDGTLDTRDWEEIE